MKFEEVQAFLAGEFPQVFGEGKAMSVERAEGGRSLIRLAPRFDHLRPGGTVSGPTLMMCADAAAYAALLSIDAHAKMALTTNLNINFLKAAPADADLLTRCQIIKNGKRLAVVESEIVSGADPEPVAHAVMTYSYPPRPAG